MSPPIFSSVPSRVTAKMFAFKIFILATFIAVLTAQEAKNSEPAEIITERSSVRADGYDFEFKTSDGVSRKEEGQLITVGDQQGIGVRGSYSYTAPDGQQFEITFTADDKGYKPQIHVVPSQ